MRARVFVLLSVVPLVVVCATSRPKEEVKPAQTQPLGASCAVVEAELPRSTCAEGLVCAPLPGGMCTKPCGGGLVCPDGATCVDGPTIGEMCAKSCTSDVDCRGDEGFVCDGATSACVPPGTTAPKLGTCAAPAPRKKRFAKAVQLTDKSDLGAWQTDAAGGVLPTGDLVTLYASMGRMGEPSNVGTTLVPKTGDPVDGPLKSEKAQAQDPWMAVDAAGKVHAVWLDGEGGMRPEKALRVAYATTTDGKTWSPVAAVHDDADCPATEKACLDAPMIAVGPSKEDPKKEALYVAYHAPKKNELRVRRSLDGGATWEPSVAAGPGVDGDLEVSSDGEVHVVTATAVRPDADRFGDAGVAVEHRKSVDGGKTFSVGVRVNAPDEPVPFFFGAPQVAYDAKKKIVYVAYTSGTSDGKWNVKLASSKDGTTFASIQVNDDVPCANHRAPALALDAKSGRPHLAWIENRTDRGGVAYARCEAGGKKCGANEAVNDEAFATYTFARRATKEVGRRPWLVVDAKGKKLHALWTQTVDQEGAAFARVFYASGKLE